MVSVTTPTGIGEVQGVDLGGNVRRFLNIVGAVTVAATWSVIHPLLAGDAMHAVVVLLVLVLVTSTTLGLWYTIGVIVVAGVDVALNALLQAVGRPFVNSDVDVGNGDCFGSRAHTFGAMTEQALLIVGEDRRGGCDDHPKKHPDIKAHQVASSCPDIAEHLAYRIENGWHDWHLGASG